MFIDLVLTSTNRDINKKDPTIPPQANDDKAFHGTASIATMPVLYFTIPDVYLIVKRSGTMPAPIVPDVTGQGLSLSRGLRFI
jgi:hypothetical protein